MSLEKERKQEKLAAQRLKEEKERMKIEAEEKKRVRRVFDRSLGLGPENMINMLPILRLFFFYKSHKFTKNV